MSAGRRYRVFATTIALLGTALSLAGFLAARSPAAARLAGTSDGVLALAIGLWFTALAVLVVRHYGRRSAELAAAYHDLHRATLQRERSEGALRESERFIRATLDSMETMIAVLDADGVVLTVNRAWRDCPDALVGRSGACDVGTSYLALCEGAADDRAADGRLLAAGIRDIVAGTRDSFALQSSARHESRWLLTHVTRFPGRGPLRLVVTHQDATSLALSHRAVEQEKEHFQMLAEAAPVAVFRADATGRLTYANRRLATLLGVPPEAAGTAWADRVYPDDRSRVLGLWRRMVAELRSDEWTYRLVAFDGTVRTCLLRASVVRDGAGRADGFVGTIVDLTEARQTDEAFRALTLVPELEGDTFFETLVRTLTTVLGVDHAFVAALDDEHGRARTIAAAAAGARCSRPDFELAGTPAADALGSETACTYPGDVQWAFPRDPWLRERDLSAYSAIALRNAAGGAIGVLVVASRNAFASPAHVESILAMFAMRMASELERRRGQEALRASEQRFRTLAESAPVGVFLADAAGECVYTNPAWHHLSGLAEHESAGSGWARAIHPDDSERVLDAWRAFVTRGEPYDIEYRVRTPTGEVRWIKVLAKALGGDPWGAGGAVGSVLDITERRTLEDRTRALNTELVQRVADRTHERDRFFTLALDMLCVGNATHFTMVNPAFTDALGYSAEELLARPCLEFIHPDDRAATQRQAERLVAGERVLRFENRYRHRDGSWRWLSWMAIPDSPDVVFASARDVTDLKAAEAELKRSAEELRDLYDRAPCGYHSLDAQGVLVAINDTALAWLGWRREELLGRRFADLLTPASRGDFETAFARLTADGAIRDLEFDVVRRDGTVLPVVVNATAVTDAAGRYVRSRSTMFDITDRRRAVERVAALNEALAHRAEELEKANRELESFSYSVSHDLRAPLRAIDGFARILNEESGEQLDAPGRRNLGIIRENAGRMARLIDALLDLSRLRRRPFMRTQIDMAALARSVVDDVRRQHPDREVAVEVDGLAPATGDPTQLRQVLANLIGNAFKYTSKVAHPCVDVGSIEHEGATVYYVRDNGAGFDMRYADKLFRVFQRLHAPGEFDGTGIGLAVVQRVVERHGGRVWAEGRVGEGATFFFTLGAEPAPDASAETR